MKVLFVAIAVSLLSTNSAFADWDIQNSGEDVFGNVNITARSFGDNGNTIIFECGSSSEPFLAFLLRDSSGSIPSVPAEFLYVDQDGIRRESDAFLQSWNDNFVSVRVTDLDMLRGMAENMVVAAGSISVGISVPRLDLRVADTFSSRGSTAAGRVLLEICLSN